jgi:succinate dehydrogenase flavin-adding protein (antitoxin of CptAB toxin-antitoxin module)
MTDLEMNRLRWHCRRGMLENDLILGRFLDAHGAQLDGRRLAAFSALLEYADDELWGVVSGRRECGDPALEEVVQLLRRC